MSDNELQKFCKENNIDLIKVLVANQRKDTHLILVNDTKNKKLIVKLFSKNSPEIVKQSIRNEIDFYKKNSSDYLLQYISSGNNFFILEYFTGSPLPKIINEMFFQKNVDVSKEELLFSDLASILNWFHNIQNGPCKIIKNERPLVYNSLFDRIGNLLSSGPKGTSALKFESFLLRQIFRIFSRKLKIKLMRLVEGWEDNNLLIISHYGHNDLHCNNILADKNLTKFKLIDFENTSSPGVWLTDTLYFFANLYAIFFSKYYAQKKIKDETFKYILHREPNLNPIEVKRLINLFCLSAEVNSRFRLVNKGLKLNKIFAFLNAIIRL